jgi:hypothetical protein
LGNLLKKNEKRDRQGKNVRKQRRLLIHSEGVTGGEEEAD